MTAAPHGFWEAAFASPRLYFPLCTRCPTIPSGRGRPGSGFWDVEVGLTMVALSKITTGLDEDLLCVWQSARGGEKEEREEGNPVGKPVGAWHRHRKNPDHDDYRHNFVRSCAVLGNATGLDAYAQYTELAGGDAVIGTPSTRRGVRWEDITRYVFACFYCSSLSLLLSDCTSVRASIKLDPDCAALERKGGSNVASNCTRLNVARNCLLSEYLVFSIDIPNFCRDPCSIIPRSSPHDTSLLASKLFLGR